MLVEKLSVAAPDGQTKIKTLSIIAQEHSVKWDAKSFEEKDLVPPSDLLSVSSNSRKEGTQYVEPLEASHAQAPPPSNKNKIYSSPINYSHQILRTSPEAGRFASSQNFGHGTKFQTETRPPVSGNDGAHVFQGDSDTSSLRWNMEFKDVSSAAQATAKSAGQASIAARAAAQFSGHQYPTESHRSNVMLQDDGSLMPRVRKFLMSLCRDSLLDKLDYGMNK